MSQAQQKSTKPVQKTKIIEKNFKKSAPNKKNDKRYDSDGEMPRKHRIVEPMTKQFRIKQKCQFHKLYEAVQNGLEKMQQKRNQSLNLEGSIDHEEQEDQDLFQSYIIPTVFRQILEMIENHLRRPLNQSRPLFCLDCECGVLEFFRRLYRRTVYYYEKILIDHKEENVDFEAVRKEYFDEIIKRVEIQLEGIQMLFEDDTSQHLKPWTLSRIQSPKDLIFATQDQENDISDPPKQEQTDDYLFPQNYSQMQNQAGSGSDKTMQQ